MRASRRIGLARQGRLGRITLDRPEAINALSPDMVETIDAALQAWAVDDSVSAVLVEGAGTRGLCAGGDIRWVHEQVRQGRAADAHAALGVEYRMTARIARYPKPYIAFMPGLVMGGGVGLSAWGSHRVVTGSTRLAMPEVAIGFVPDVGGTWLLSRAPGLAGFHAALTAEPMGPADAIACGLADHHVPEALLPELAASLSSCTDAASVARCIAALATPPGPVALDRDWIASCYLHDSVDAILRALLADPAPQAIRAAGLIGRHCPTALAVTLAALRRALSLDMLEACLDLEFRLAGRLLRRADFLEGVRAAVIDKDRRPIWSPAALGAVDPALVEMPSGPEGGLWNGPRR